MTATQETQGISVVLCSYNNAQFLERCISSIIAQNYAPLQIIILDDASTDNTQHVLAPYQNRAGFTLLKNDHNLGLTKSLNIAMAAAEYPLIARIDADDVMLPGRLAHQAQALLDDDVILSGSNAIQDYEDEGIILTPQGKSRFFDQHDAFLSNPFAHSSVTFKRSAFDAVGGYDEHFAKCQDFDLWKKMKAYGRLHLSAQHYTKRSIHDGMITRKSAFAQFKFTQQIRFRNLALPLIVSAIIAMMRDAIFIAVPRFIKRMYIWRKHADQVVDAVMAQGDKPVMVHLCTSMQIGGAQIAMASMLNNEHFTPSYRSCVVAFGGGSTLIPKLIEDGTPVANFRINSIFSAVCAYIYLRRLIKKIKPDAMYSWLYHTHMMSIIAKLNFPYLKLYWAIHSWKREFLSKRTNAVVSICAKASRWIPQHIIYASQASRNVHAEYGFDDRKAIVIENGTRLIHPKPQHMSPQERAAFDDSKDKTLIGTVSRFVIEKDIDNFIAMATILKTKHSNLRFVMIGAGLSAQNNDLTQALTNAGLSDETVLIEASTDLGSWLNRMDVFCLTSKSESFPLVIGEAILAGTIPVSTDVGGVGHIIPQDTASLPPLIVPAQDAQAFANSVSHVITMTPADQSACLSQLQHHVSTHFSEDQSVRKHMDLFTS